MKFRCTWSKLVTYITFAVIGLLGFALYKLGIDGHIEVFTFILIIILVCFSYTPLYIEVTEESLILRRVMGSISIYRKDIQAITAYKVKGAIRQFGSGGFFGYLGWFFNSEIGSYFSYSTDENSQILIITKYRKYVISCENREDLLRKFI